MSAAPQNLSRRSVVKFFRTNRESINLENLRRVSVVGTSGSGKTTFAKNLASILQVEHIELDAVYWLPDCVERPADEFLSSVDKANGESDE